MTITPHPHLQLIDDKADPTDLLNYLMMALCESYNLDFTEITVKLQTLIMELQHEVCQKNMDYKEFDTLANFITRIAGSNEKTLDEFLRYVETTAT